MLKCVKIHYKILLLKFRSYIHFLLFLSLSFPFFLTKQTGVLTDKTWSLSDQMTTLLSKDICRLVCNVRSCWSCLTHEVFKI